MARSNVCSFRYGLSLARLGQRSSSRSALPLIPTTARKVSRGPITHWAGPWRSRRAPRPVRQLRRLGAFPEPERIRSTASGCADNPPESSTLKNRGLQPSATRAQVPWYRKRMVRSPHLFRSLPCASVTQESLRYLNCHEGGAIYLGDALRAEPGGISGSHALCVPAWGRNTGRIPGRGEVKVLVTQPCPTLCDPVDRSPPGSWVREITQARILEWVAIPSSRGSSWPRDQTRVLGFAADSLPLWDKQRRPLSILPANVFRAPVRA